MCTQSHRILQLHIVIAIFILLVGCNQNPAISVDLTENPDTPELFAPNVISTDLYERDIAISPDGNEIIYTLGTYDQSRRCLVSMIRTRTGWGEKHVVSFSGSYDDLEPFFAADGETLFFVSTRPMPGDSTREDYNIWKSTRVEGIWGEPIPLNGMINTHGGEYYPSVSRNGNLYFTSTRDDGIGREDIFMSRYLNGEYQKPEVLDTNVNSATLEFNAFISPEEDLLIFGSYGRPDGLGGGDLYYSMKNSNGTWSKAVNMGAMINSKKLDYCPFVDFARGNFYFTSERISEISEKIQSPDELRQLAESPLNGMGNIYRVGFDALGIK